MLKYEFKMVGKSLVDGHTYWYQCWCNGMSKSEKEAWAKEHKLDLKTVSISKHKAK